MFEEEQGYSASDGAGRCSTVATILTGGATRREPGVTTEIVRDVCDLLGEEVNNTTGGLPGGVA